MSGKMRKKLTIDSAWAGGSPASGAGVRASGYPLIICHTIHIGLFCRFWEKVARITSNNFSCGTFCMFSLSDITATPKQLVGHDAQHTVTGKASSKC